jgi:organic radical activating enzyme
MTNKAKIKEIFSSIQGEGLFIGKKQVFVRFCSCNLRCDYCDTDFLSEGTYFEYTTDELLKHIEQFDLSTVHSISLTGGEPLMWVDFIQELISKSNHIFYLETNGTMAKSLEKIIDKIDIISADIKLPSCSGIKNSFDLHREFFEVCENFDRKNIFAKIVFDENITDEEIQKCAKLGQDYNIELILQPKMIEDKMAVSTEFILQTFEKFAKLYKNIRLIPQVHKFLDVE